MQLCCPSGPNVSGGVDGVCGEMVFSVTCAYRCSEPSLP